jgi:hypothetical protein
MCHGSNLCWILVLSVDRDASIDTYRSLIELIDLMEGGEGIALPSAEDKANTNDPWKYGASI